MIMEDRVVDKILNYEIKIKSITFKVVDLLFVFLPSSPAPDHTLLD